jgi:enoyl-CoA hydratase/carnithine racemase
MTSDDKTGLEIEQHGTTLIVRIDGGEHALLDPGMAAQLGRLVDRADKDPSIHAVVFTGAHPDRFLSHADITWLQEGGVGDVPEDERERHHLHRGTQRLGARHPRGIRLGI